MNSLTDYKGVFVSKDVSNMHIRGDCEEFVLEESGKKCQKSDLVELVGNKIDIIDDCILKKSNNLITKD